MCTRRFARSCAADERGSLASVHEDRAAQSRGCFCDRARALIDADGVLSLAWLSETLLRTRVALAEAASGHPEGVVVRTEDRSVIAKIRYEDYKRTVPRDRAGLSR